MTSPSPIPSSDWNSWFDHSIFLTPAVPHHGTSHDPQPILQYPLWFPSFLHLHPIILPSLPLFQLTHYSLHDYDPKTISLGRGHHRVRRGTHFIRVEDRDDIYYWITCHMDNTGVEFSIQVGWDLVIDPTLKICNQDLLKYGVWCGCGGVIFLNSFDSPKGCNIGDWEGRCEMQGRDKHREGQRGMSSEDKDMEHQDWLCNIIDQHIKHPSDDLRTFLTPLILIQQLTHYDSHTALRQYPTPHQVKSSDQVIFPFLS